MTWSVVEAIKKVGLSRFERLPDVGLRARTYTMVPGRPGPAGRPAGQSSPPRDVDAHRFFESHSNSKFTFPFLKGKNPK